MGSRAVIHSRAENCPVGIESGQLIETGLVSVHPRGQVSNVAIRAVFPGERVCQLGGVQPGQHGVGQQLFDGVRDRG